LRQSILLDAIFGARALGRANVRRAEVQRALDT
jgi:hypothetical protein